MSNPAGPSASQFIVIGERTNITGSPKFARALKAGATEAEAVVYEGDEFSTRVRLGQVETLKESGSRAVGLRVFIGHRTASTSSSDFSAESIVRIEGEEASGDRSDPLGGSLGIGSLR